MFSIKKFYLSFVFAFRGLVFAIKHEQNFQIHLLATCFVTILMIYFRLKAWESIVLVLMIVIVLVLELINTIFERIIDVLRPRIHPYAQTIKDMMAATVLVASIGAIVVGVFVFLPYFFVVFQG